MKGIDVSHHQGKIDWQAVSKDPLPVSFAIIKATEGVTYIDPKLKHNATEAKKEGLKISYYHFASLNTTNIMEDARAEARFFVDTISGLPAPDLPLVLDIESNKSNLSPSQVVTWIRSFFVELEKLGRNDYVIYSYTPFLNANLPKAHTLGNIRLWIAHYTTKPRPALPFGWTQYWLWQYSAKGKVSGIVGDVDMNTGLLPK